MALYAVDLAKTKIRFGRVVSRIRNGRA